ncbi:MAG: hypothetical protein AAF125_15680 [Chloroflexota bacterium]
MMNYDNYLSALKWLGLYLLSAVVSGIAIQEIWLFVLRSRSGLTIGDGFMIIPLSWICGVFFVAPSVAIMLNRWQWHRGRKTKRKNDKR